MLETSIIVAFIVLFLYACTWEGMVFEFVGKALNKAPDYLKKPLYDCPICMVPWWGPVILSVGMLAGIWQLTNMVQVFIIIATAAGINTFLIYIISYCKSNTKKKCNCERKERLGLL